MGSPAIPPPPAADPNDVTPDLGPASRGSGGGMDRFRSIVNNLSGGGIPAIQERLAADFSKRQHDAQMYHDLAKTHVGLLTHANASQSKTALYGINQATGQPATAEDIQKWHNSYDTAWQAYQKLLPKDAKPIAQKMSDLVEHVIGRKGKSGAPAGQSSAPAIPPPQGQPQPAGTAGGGAGATAAAAAAPIQPGPAIPAPPGAAGSMSTATEVPPSMQPGMLGMAETQRMTGVQNRLAEEKQAEQQKADIAVGQSAREAKFPVMQWDPQGGMRTVFIGGTGKQVGEPIENSVLSKLMGAGMIHPVSIADPQTGQPIPALQNKYTGAVYDQTLTPIPDAKIFNAAILPTQKGGGGQYNADTGVTTNWSKAQKVLGGASGAGAVRPAGRPMAIPAPPTGGGGGGTGKSAAPTSQAVPSKPAGRVASMAHDYAEFGKVPAAKDSPAVETYMNAHGMTPGVKPTAQEINLSDSVRKAEPKLQEMLSFLENNKLTDRGQGGMFSLSALSERVKVQKAWEEYSHGIPPKDKQLGQLIKYAAALKVMGAAPWMSMSRGKYMYQEVAQHLPDKTDTPAQLYEKGQFFKSILDDTKGSLPPQLLKPRGGAIPAPPKGAPRTAEEYLQSIGR